jgi:p-hydroxybenzoate 3-monooxygenase
MRTQVAIVGAGPAGLLLGHLLHREGIDSVVLEAKSQTYVQERVRAGVLEHQTVDVLRSSGVGDRMGREGLVHHGIELQSQHGHHRIDFSKLTGRSVMVYGQQEVVTDLVAARRASGRELYFEVEKVAIHDIDSDGPSVTFTHEGRAHSVECDFIAGCDGFHGICRSTLPKERYEIFERVYPFAWLGVLARAAPASPELIYSNHERGFALLSMRAPKISRLYLQCAPDEDLAQWPDARLWEEFQLRLGRPDLRINEGPIFQKSVAPMRSFVVEPMRFGHLFLAGDAAHIVPPTGAKGMNLAVADVQILSHALKAYYERGSNAGLDGYSDKALARVWKAQRFSWWMTSLLHRFPSDPPFNRRVQLAELSYVMSSQAAGQSLAENYVGLPLHLD